VIIWIAGVAGAVAGALLPRLIAAIPDRPPAADAPAPVAYRDLAARNHLAFYLAGATAVVWALLAWSRGGSWDLLAFAAVGALGVAMAYVDISDHRLPDWLTYSALAAAAVLLAVAATIDGTWASYGRGWLGALAMTAAFAALALLRPGELGLGDVKLAASLGLLLGWLGWGQVILGAFLGFLVGGVYALGLVVLRRAGRRTAIPFGPFMLVGALIAIVWGEALLDAYLGR
jgi:leader peptidase (prepilin peptidase) / N-methyltransferase